MNEAGHAVTDSSGGPTIGRHESLGLEEIFDEERSLALAENGLPEWADEAWNTSGYTKDEKKPSWN